MRFASGALCLPIRGADGIELLGVTQVPSLEDLALGLGRAHRFGRQCRFPNWTVLHHSWLVHSLIWGEIEEKNDSIWRHTILATALLHDAHEAITGDVPTPWKTPQLKAEQHILDVAIFGSIGLIMPTPARKRIIKFYDVRATAAESMVVGPPQFDPSCFFEDLNSNFSDLLAAAQIESGYPLDEIYESDRRSVQAVLDGWPSPADSNHQDGDLVKLFVSQVKNHLAHVDRSFKEKKKDDGRSSNPSSRSGISKGQPKAPRHGKPSRGIRHPKRGGGRTVGRDQKTRS